MLFCISIFTKILHWFLILLLLFTLQFILVKYISGLTEEEEKEDSPEIVKPKVDLTIDDTAADDRIKR